MLMRGDFQKIIDHINPVFETAFSRIEALEAKVKELEGALEAQTAPKKGPGRPKKQPEEPETPEPEAA